MQQDVQVGLLIKIKLRRYNYDRLIGISVIISSNPKDKDLTTLIESVRYGWWYTC